MKLCFTSGAATWICVHKPIHWMWIWAGPQRRTAQDKWMNYYIVYVYMWIYLIIQGWIIIYYDNNYILKYNNRSRMVNSFFGSDIKSYRGEVIQQVVIQWKNSKLVLLNAQLYRVSGIECIWERNEHCSVVIYEGAVRWGMSGAGPVIHGRCSSCSPVDASSTTGNT